MEKKSQSGIAPSMPSNRKVQFPLKDLKERKKKKKTALQIVSENMTKPFNVNLCKVFEGNVCFEVWNRLKTPKMAKPKFRFGLFHSERNNLSN